MEIELSENDIYPDLPSGAIVSGGNFGESALSTRESTLIYLRQINPNLLVVGGFFLGGILALNMLVAGLGRANPNNQMLETRQIEAETNKETLLATTDALKTVAQQRPGCQALICIVTGDQKTQESAPPAPPAPPAPQYPDYYEPIQIAAKPIPNNPQSVDFWLSATDQAYLNAWIGYCQSEGGNLPGWRSPECQALSQALSRRQQSPL